MFATGVFVVGFVSGIWAAEGKPARSALPKERVTGIGGVFFKARDPEALSAWYREKLGLPVREEGAFSLFQWREQEGRGNVGTTVWSLFREDSKYFAPSHSTCMVNYRVDNLDRMLAQLRGMDVKVEPKVSEEFNGRFAWLIDPEGNKLELWEPKAGF